MQHSEVECPGTYIMRKSVGKGGTSARGDDDRKGGRVDALVHRAYIRTVLEKGIDHIGMAFECSNM